MSDAEKIRRQFRQIRSLIQAGRERIAPLRPVWGAYLAGEALKSLDAAMDELEKEVLPPAESDAARIPRTG
jgi:hypothetical protein